MPAFIPITDGPEPGKVTLRYFIAPTSVRKYVSRFVLIEIATPAETASQAGDAADGVSGDGMVEDYLFPDWTSFHFFDGGRHELGNLGEDLSEFPDFAVLGPRSRGLRVRFGPTRQWVFNLNPLGWAKLVGTKASDFANGVFDGCVEPSFERFRALARTLFGQVRDPRAEFARIVAFLENMLESDGVTDGDGLLLRMFEAMHDAEIATVADLAERVGCSKRKIERISIHSFGFTPKVLLSRQRFMASLVHFVTEPTSKWIGSIDTRYHDQPHFVRDFRRYMGMTPTEYAEIEKPIALPAMRERLRFRKELFALYNRLGPSGYFGFEV